VSRRLLHCALVWQGNPKGKTRYTVVSGRLDENGSKSAMASLAKPLSTLFRRFVPMLQGLFADNNGWR